MCYPTTGEEWQRREEAKGPGTRISLACVGSVSKNLREGNEALLPNFLLTPGALLRSLVRSPPGKEKETAATQARVSSPYELDSNREGRCLNASYGNYYNSKARPLRRITPTKTCGVKYNEMNGKKSRGLGGNGRKCPGKTR